jgi:hypothetical protein
VAAIRHDGETGVKKWLSVLAKIRQKTASMVAPGGTSLMKQIGSTVTTDGGWLPRDASTRATR